MNWVILLEVWGARSLWVKALELLERALQLQVLRISSTLSSRVKLQVMWGAVTGTGVAAGLSLGLELMLLLAELFALVL
jgi:hypothetical protein